MAPVKLDIYRLFSKLPQRQNLPDLFPISYGLFQKIHQDYLGLGGAEEHLDVGEMAWLGIPQLRFLVTALGTAQVQSCLEPFPMSAAEGRSLNAARPGERGGDVM